ncbi:hypothetical protein Ciccas_005276 [Cichlidogyrus casuarinus]|uniref:Uncharacterized protein n=1 Tax=Cichlidogyrus casuarinus TaxID=1844966 RepID=A0ABD2QA12_9PLAT
MAASQQMTYQMARSPNHSPSQIPLMYHSPAHSPAVSMSWKPANMQLMEIMSNSSGSGPSQCRLQTFRATQKSPLEEQAGYTSGLGSAITTTCCEVCSDEGVDTASSSVKLPPAMPKQRSDMFAGLPGSESSDVLVSMMGALEDEMDWDELQMQLRQQQKMDLLPPPNF